MIALNFYEKQINELKKQGIVFLKINEKDALEYLVKYNYFYRLFNSLEFFLISNKNKKIDFALLLEVSSVDLLLRKWVLSSVLDLEHLIKCDFLAAFNRSYYQNEIQKSILNFLKLHQEKKNILLKLWLKKYKELEIYDFENNLGLEMNILIDLMDFGTMLMILKRLKKEQLLKISINLRYLFSILKLRNICAHNDSLFFNGLEKEIFQCDPILKQEFKIIKEVEIKDLNNSFINNFLILISLLFYFKDSKVINQRQKEFLTIFLEININSKNYPDLLIKYLKIINIYWNFKNHDINN